MSSKHLVDPDLLPLFDQMPRMPANDGGLAASRAALLAMRAAKTPPLPDVEMSTRHIPGPENEPDIRVLIYEPKAAGAARPAILHIHGGGYVMGAPEIVETLDMAYASELGAVVVSVDYRLAPETPHPGPVEDCYAALVWLHANADELGIDRGRIAITGESAGGGLAAATTLLARDRAHVPVVFQHLIFPMLDDRTAIDDDPSPYVGEFVWTRRANAFGWRALLGAAPGGPDVSPYASPARAETLSGLPATFIACGAIDLLIEEDMEYARRLIRAGVPTELHIYPGAPHGFMTVVDAPVAKAFARDSMAAWKRAFRV